MKKIILLCLILILSGCETLGSMKDDDFSVGCKVTEAEAKLGFFNQQGSGAACKLKCSKELPVNFKYKYDNPRTGCHIELGTE